MKKSIKIISVGFFSVGIFCLIFSVYAYYAGIRLVRLEPKRIEKCLDEYILFRNSQDTETLERNLKKLGISRKLFEKVIDRFIYYRTSQSSVNQAKELLQVFESHYHLVPTGTIFTTETASYSFRLDAEILTVMKENPALVKKAFGS